MACLDEEQIESILEGSCDVDDRTWKKLVVNLLCLIQEGIINPPADPDVEYLTQALVEVGVTSTLVVAAEPTRVGGYIRNNDGLEQAFVMFGGANAVVGLQQLNPGEVYTLPKNMKQEIQGIRGGASGTVQLEIVTWQEV